MPARTIAVHRGAIRGLVAAIGLGIALVTGLAACAAQPQPSAAAAASAAAPGTPSSTPTPTPGSSAGSTPLAEPFSSLVVGDCLSNPAGSEGTEVGTVSVISCALSHTAEVYALPTLSGGGYPGDETVSSAASDACGGAFTAYVGVGYETSDLDYSFYAPDQDGWNSGTRQVTCVVFYPQGNTVGSVKGVGTTPPQLAG